MAGSRGEERRPSARSGTGRVAPRPPAALQVIAEGGARVLVVGLEELGEQELAVLADRGIDVIRVADAPAALRALADQAVEVLLVDARRAEELIAAVRARPDAESAHVIVGVALDAPRELRAALDAGADDVMRVPFEPEVLAARVAAGLRAARLRANEALLRSLVANVPGAVYRCACDEHWTMEWLSDEIQTISGYPATDFIRSSTRTFASIIHPADRDRVQRSVADGVREHRAFTIEYRIVRPDGTARWVLERGRLQDAADGMRWLDGAIFDITARRAAEQALREREVVRAQLAEVRASRARLLEAADRARREIERNLHDGAQQRFVAVALRLQSWMAANRDLPADSRGRLDGVLDELRTGLAELRDLARGVHPAVLTDRGLADAVSALAHRATVPVELRVALGARRLPMPVEAAAYFTVCEALTNVARYARASRAWVTVEHRGDELEIEVADDGVGGADFAAGSGLQGLRDRVEAVDGTLEVTTGPAGGTILRARLPVGVPRDTGADAVSGPSVQAGTNLVA